MKDNLPLSEFSPSECCAKKTIIQYIVLFFPYLFRQNSQSAEPFSVSFLGI